MVASTKVAIFLCATIAVSMAAPALNLNLGTVLGNILNPVVGIVGNTVGSLLSTLDQLVKNLTPEVSALLGKLSKILNISNGQNPLAFVANLISELDNILTQLLGTVGSGVEDVEEIASGLIGDLHDLVNQLTQLLNVPKGTNLVSFIEGLIPQLEKLVQEILKIVSHLVKQLLKKDGLVDDLLKGLLGIVSNLQVAGLLGQLASSLSQILDVLKVANL